MLTITSITAAVSAIALIGLSFSVSLARMKTGIEIGMGEDDRLLRRVRAQGNFIEYVPLALILLALAEFRGASSPWILIAAGLLLAGRAAHAFGMLANITTGRAIGMLCTYGSLITGVGAIAIGSS